MLRCNVAKESALFKYSKFIVPLIATLALMACDDEQEQANQGPPATVGAPIIRRITEWDEFTGRFRAADRVEVRARVSGYLEAIKFEDGQKVNAGDTLFIIDQRPFKIALERAESRYELTRKEYERARTLRQKGAASQQDEDQRFNELREAKANLEEARLNLQFTEVKSPIEGRVSRHQVDVGNLVSGSESNATLLTTVVDDDPVQFYFEASEQELLKYVRLEQEGKRESSRTAERDMFVKLQDEKEFKHQGKINFVDNEVDRTTGTIQAYAVIDNPYGVLVPGLFGRARMAGSGEYQATLVPDNVIGTNQTVKFVYVVNNENMVEQRPVEVGPLHEDGLRIIRSGLNKDDRVVMAGIMMIRPGMKVTPQEQGAQPAATPAEKTEEDE
jgi:RND family efflux transporter MFP subunit